MPIYGYGCRNCGHTLDVLQKISDDPLVDCPECGEPQLKRQLSAPRFRLKGSGWYETDFKKDKQRNLHGDKDPVVQLTQSARLKVVYEQHKLDALLHVEMGKGHGWKRTDVETKRVLDFLQKCFQEPTEE